MSDIVKQYDIKEGTDIEDGKGDVQAIGDQGDQGVTPVVPAEEGEKKEE